MAGLDQFERLMERVVEGSVGRVFRSQVHPTEIGRRLEQAMEARPLVSVSGTIVPNEYRVYLNPEDAASFQPMQQGLCEEFARWLEVIGGERGYRFMGPISVALLSDANIARRDVQVQAVTQSPNPPPQAPPPVAPPYVPPAPPTPPPTFAPSVPPGAPPGRGLDTFTVRQEPRRDAPQRPPVQNGPNGPRPGVSAPLAAGPNRAAPPALRGAVAYFALRTPAGERAFPLRFGAATLGRALDNDVVLESNDVSRRHARLEPAGSVLRLVDLGSTNGIRVNGRRVQEHLLRDGDLVEIGSVQLVFHVGDPDAR